MHEKQKLLSRRDMSGSKKTERACRNVCDISKSRPTYVFLKDDKTEENTFEILQHSDRNINNS